MSIPNLITLARILLVPVVVWAIASNQMLFAFLLFAAAGVSDAVDPIQHAYEETLELVEAFPGDVGAQNRLNQYVQALKELPAYEPFP